jgi:hypothetical protein
MSFDFKRIFNKAFVWKMNLVTVATTMKWKVCFCGLARHINGLWEILRWKIRRRKFFRSDTFRPKEVLFSDKSMFSPQTNHHKKLKIE